MKKVIRYCHFVGMTYVLDYAKIGKKDIDTVIAELMQNDSLSNLQNRFAVGEIDKEGNPIKESFEDVLTQDVKGACEIVEKLKTKEVDKVRKSLRASKQKEIDGEQE